MAHYFTREEAEALLPQISTVPFRFKITKSYAAKEGN
jgi:hypothetical protein